MPYGTSRRAKVMDKIIPNDNGKEVIVFAPEIIGTLEKSLTDKGVKIFKEISKLVDYVKPK